MKSLTTRTSHICHYAERNNESKAENTITYYCMNESRNDEVKILNSKKIIGDVINLTKSAGKESAINFIISGPVPL